MSYVKFVNLRRRSMPQGDSRLVSLDGSHHKEQQYIWYKDGI